MGVYVHIPFCERKCYYCDFHSVVVSDPREFAQIADNYLISLRQEAVYYRRLWGEQRLTTLFIGGGTPNILPAEKLATFISFVLSELPFSEEPEITIEANPHFLTLEDAQILATAGVNRVSLGVQAFENDLLKAIGRVHVVEDIEQSVFNLNKAGIKDINLDLMFGLPAQTKEQWFETLKAAISLKPTHLSCYGLILEPHTPFATWYSAGLLDLPDDDLQADMYELACGFLVEAGFEHYEISNFCLPDQRSRHNLHYWHNLPFIALGSGATGYINNLRYTNVPDLKGYMQGWEQGTPHYESEELTSIDQEMDETMMLGMRLLQGVSAEAFRRRYKVSYFVVYEQVIADLLERNLVEYVGGYLRVTKAGLLFENLVSGAFLR